MPKGFKLDWRGPQVAKTVNAAAAKSLNEIAADIVGTARERAAKEAHASGEYLRSIRRSRYAKASKLRAGVEAGARHSSPIESKQRLLFGAQRKHWHLNGLARRIRSKLR